MTYTIRPGFTITIPSGTFTGGQSVELTPEEFEANKHKLEGVESDVPDLNPGVNSDCCDAPVVSSISPTRLFIGFDAQLTIKGSFFRPSMTVQIGGVTVNSVEFKSDNLVEVNITVGSETQFSNVTLDNGKELVIENAIELLDPEDSIIDLRSGGTGFSDSAIEVRSGMSWERSNEGLFFRGNDPWRSWARFVGDDDQWVWNREEKHTLSWIFRHTSSVFMLGIGSRSNAPTDNFQFRQAEVLGYFTNTTFISVFGSTGSLGNTTSVSVNQAVPTEFKKLTIENNGEPGARVLLHGIGSEPNQWLDDSNLLAEVEIPNSFGADEPEIMPFVIPRNGASTLFLGMILI